MEGVCEVHILGRAYVHIKAIGSTPIPHQSETSIEGVGGHYPLSMLGGQLNGVGVPLYKHMKNLSASF